MEEGREEEEEEEGKRKEATLRRVAFRVPSLNFLQRL